MKEKIIKQFFNGNKELTPLAGRKPLEDCWTTITISQENIYAHKGNLGWKLGPEDFVIDIDPRNGGDKSYEQLAKDFNLKLEPTVTTASGGIHIYCKLPKEYIGKKFKKTNKKYPGIDFLTKGMQCVIPGCKAVNKVTLKVGEYKWADEELGCFEQNNMEPYTELLDLCLNNYNSFANSNDDNEDFGISSDSSWPIDKVTEMLYKLDPDMGNDEWVKVGMALQNWDDVAGLELWEEWSKPGRTYKEGETAKRWPSFKRAHGVSIGTLYYMAKEVDIYETVEKINKYVDKIKKSDETTIRHTIASNLKKEHLATPDVEKLAKAIQDRFKELNGFKLPVSAARNMISNVNLAKGYFINDVSDITPEWCNKWLYVNSLSAFANKETFTVHKTESFNLENGINIPASMSGSKQRAFTYVSDNNFIEKVEYIAYLPTVKDQICEIDGLKAFNIFNPKTIPIEAVTYTEEGLKAIEIVKKHLLFIFGNQQNADIMLNWMAHNVQFYGVKIIWSPVIQGIEGIGKSFFGELLRHCLGDINVGTVSPTQIISDFNGWAKGKVLNIVEEIRIKGQNRHEAVNAIKPLITDRMIQINEKNVKPYVTYNVTNYLLHTNFKDAIPITDDDRRWWVIFAAIQNLNDLKKFVGEDKTTYFPKLFDTMRANALEIKKWLLEHQIPDEFLNIKQAPMTGYKELMIATEETGFEGLQELKELINIGGEYFNNDCISSADLFETFMFEYPEVVISDNKKHVILKKLGYLNTKMPIKINGKARRIWVKKPMTNEEIRKTFEF